MSSIDPKIEPSWRRALAAEFESDYFHQLKNFLQQEKERHSIFPPGNKIFAAFDITPFQDVKVVILGQDPYHGAGQANGLSFSVTKGIRQPPSLQNIFKELHKDLGIAIPEHGDLSKWAKQGVLLLNTVLTVRQSAAGSHREKGWEHFTDAVITKLSEEKKGLVFILWGNFARSKKSLINQDKHHIIESPHPSPFSASNGFFGSRPFSKTNELLQKEGKEPIDWSI